MKVGSNEFFSLLLNREITFVVHFKADGFEQLKER
jgi:hypothetical protein